MCDAENISEATEYSATLNERKCRSCGAEIDPASKFCPKCGSAVSVSAPVSADPAQQQNNNSPDRFFQTGEPAHIEESVRSLRNDIIKSLSEEPSEKYLLKSLLWPYAAKCFPGPVDWALAQFYLDLNSRGLFAEVATYPNQFGACREETFILTAPEFHKMAIENNMGTPLIDFETVEDWQKLFNKDLNDAIADASATIRKRNEKYAVRISGRSNNRSGLLIFQEIRLALFLRFGTKTLTVRKKNGKYRAEFSHVPYGSSSKKECSRDLSAAESVWLQKRVVKALLNRNRSTWQPLTGDAEMDVVIKGPIVYFVNKRSTKAIRKYSDLLDEIEDLVKYGSIDGSTGSVKK